ncbi:MAG: TetR family transcriptional regulator [Cellvibrionales bacterium]|nr:TetR family transcriptional regulator [Cellvibrionales bacterium]
MTVMPLTKAALMTERVPAGAGKRERTRQALLEAAIRMLAERGLEGTSIDDLMRAAGMARAPSTTTSRRGKHWQSQSATTSGKPCTRQ